MIEGYNPPILKLRRKIERRSPVTGLVSIDWKTESEQISWEVARSIINQFGSFKDEFKADYAHVFPFVNIANSEGMNPNAG